MARGTKSAGENKWHMANVTSVPECIASHQDTMIMSIILRAVTGPETPYSFPSPNNIHIWGQPRYHLSLTPSLFCVELLITPKGFDMYTEKSWAEE